MIRETRSTLLGAALALVLASLASSPAASARPNIVFILADDMGFSDLGCYGSEIETPHLDALAAGGLRFTQFYNTSKCFPSRACLLTGVYAQQAGMGRHAGKLRDAVTLAEVLRDRGYRTLMAGKHHGTENPFERGFDRYFGLRDGACNYFNPGRVREGELVPAQKRPDRAWCIDHVTYKPYTPPDQGFYTTDAFTDAALGYLEEYRDETAPFFLYLAYNAPHDPLQAWPADIAKYRGRYLEGYAPVRQRRWAKQRALGLFSEGVTLSEPEFGDWSALTQQQREEEDLRMAVYAAMVDRLDQNIGRLLAKLDALGERENTLIFFGSDNGASSEVVEIGSGSIGTMTRWASQKRHWANVSNTPFRKYKNYSFEGGITSPLVVSWPGRLASPGRIEPTPTHLIDVMATLAEVARAPYPAVRAGREIVPMQGVSLLPLLEGRSLAHRPPLFWQWRNGKAVRQGRWKLVSHGGPWQLYDLDADRTERHDLAHLQPGVTRRLTALWGEWADGVGLAR